CLVEQFKPAAAACHRHVRRQAIGLFLGADAAGDSGRDFQTDEVRGDQLRRAILGLDGRAAPRLGQKPLPGGARVHDDHPRLSRSSRISRALSEKVPYFCWSSSSSARSCAPTSCFSRSAASVSAWRSSPSRLRPCCLAWVRNQPTTQSLILRTRTSAIQARKLRIIRSTVASYGDYVKQYICGQMVLMGTNRESCGLGKITSFIFHM